MFIWIAAIIIGVLFLAKGADFFVESASIIARKFRIHPMIVGVVVLGFATATPEMVVSAIAAWHEHLGMSVGNAIGSNIANIGLVLGATAVVTPLVVSPCTLSHEVPAVFLSMLWVTGLVWDRILSFGDGLMIVAGFIVMIVWLCRSIQKRPHEHTAALTDSDVAEVSSNVRMASCFVLGLIAMFIGSRLMVYGAKNIAEYFGISDFIIGLSIVAIGTSLPELAASIVAAYRGEHDIALGNVLGSNLFNMLAVMAMPALIMPGTLPDSLLYRDIPVMFAITVLMLALLLLASGRQSSGAYSVGRCGGAVLLSSFFAYNVALFWLGA